MPLAKIGEKIAGGAGAAAGVLADELGLTPAEYFTALASAMLTVGSSPRARGQRPTSRGG